jgi:hypothetical protein
LDSLEDAEFWRARANQLNSMAERQKIELARNKEHQNWLVGLVIYSGPDDHLGRSEARGGLDSVFRSRFDEIAGRSAIALGCPSGLQPIAFWLHCLWQDLICNHPEMADRELYQSSSTGGIVHDLLSSSEAYCLRLALMMECKLADASDRRPGIAPGPDPNDDSGTTSKPGDTFYVDSVHFQYRYAEDFPADAQRQIESLRKEANEHLQTKPINSFEDLSEAKRAWLPEVASGAATIIGKFAAMKSWSANQIRETLKDFTLNAAYAARMTTPAVERFFRSDEWKTLDDALFPPPESRGKHPPQAAKEAPSSLPQAGQDGDTAEAAARRQKAVMPILQGKRWKRGRWATKSGVGKNCIYEYLDGTRNPNTENRQAMAEALGLKPEDLPE